MKKSIIASLGAVALPSLALAADINSLLFNFDRWVSWLTGIVASLALLVFFWGVVRYIAAAGDEKGKERGKTIMTWGVIALFVMFSVFGIIRFLQNSFDIRRDNQNMRPPEVEFRGSGDDDDWTLI